MESNYNGQVLIWYFKFFFVLLGCDMGKKCWISNVYVVCVFYFDFFKFRVSKGFQLTSNAYYLVFDEDDAPEKKFKPFCHFEPF